VAIRFKTSTSARQIDSLIAATGVEVFPSVERPGCRRYVLRVVRLEDEPTKIASVLQESGLVDYATPDFSAGRPEGISSDSLFVDQVALRNAITKDDNTVDVAPATYGMGQVLSAYAGPLLRVGGATLSAQMSPPSSMSALDFVRSNGLTTLRLDIPEGSPVASVRVVLYSLDGTPVRQLVSEALEAGRYIVGWDGKDDRGRRVQPGVYVAVMTAGSFRETHRLVVR
jgi:5-hydroxyisourate hydrolase-like protein (transthyretin family)